ncbi:MAG: putative rane protein, partial [Microbacterium sp.]|nr:putative rane protein [Microbacterium sp.]
MSTPELVPRRSIGGIVGVWVVALLTGIAIAVFVPDGERATWMSLALGLSLILAFSVQLFYGRAQRFIQRVAISTLGAMLILGVISATFGLGA